MHCSYCGTTLPAQAPFCPNCGRPTVTYTPQQGTPDKATPTMDFGPLQETSSISPDVAPPSAPVQPYQPQQQSQQPVQNQQPYMKFGSGSEQAYPPSVVPPQQQPAPPYPQSQQYPQQSAMPYGPGQASLPLQQQGMFFPGQSYSNPVHPLQQQSGTFGQEQRYPTMDRPQQQQQGTYSQGYFAQPERPLQNQRRLSGPSTAVIVLLVVLVTAIIGGGGILLYATGLLPGSQHSPTNTVSKTQTKTPAIQATTSITTTNPQDLYTQIMSRTPTLNDPLTAQDANSWQDLSTLQSCTFTSGALHLHGAAGSCIGEATNFSNFAYQVKMTIIQGNIGGIAFRFDAINRKFYYFAINPDGLYAVIYTGGGTSSSNGEKLLASATSSAIITGLNQPNTLTVIVRGSNINIYINKQFVTTLTDNSITIGAIGMLGGNSAGSTSDVAFSDAQVWTL